jgi:uncharacterized protein
MALNVSLPAELENRVREHVASGMYGSASEVIREALRLFEAYQEAQKPMLQNLRSSIVTGILGAPAPESERRKSSGRGYVRLPQKTRSTRVPVAGTAASDSEQVLDAQTLKAVRRFKKWLAGTYPVRDVIVYGSRARGTHRPDSDADVAVILGGEHQLFLDTKLKMSDAAYDILLETGVNISPLPVWLDEWEHPEQYVNPALLANIAREGVRV